MGQDKIVHWKDCRRNWSKGIIFTFDYHKPHAALWTGASLAVFVKRVLTEGPHLFSELSPDNGSPGFCLFPRVIWERLDRLPLQKQTQDILVSELNSDRMPISKSEENTEQSEPAVMMEGVDHPEKYWLGFCFSVVTGRDIHFQTALKSQLSSHAQDIFSSSGLMSKPCILFPDARANDLLSLWK